MFDDLTDIDFLKISINELQKKLKHLFSMLNEDELDEEESKKLSLQIEKLQGQISKKQSELKKMYKELTSRQKETQPRYNFE